MQKSPNQYIVCRSKRNQPRVALQVCQACRNAAKCPDFQAYLEPFMFDELRVSDKNRSAYRYPSGMPKSKGTPSSSTP